MDNYKIHRQNPAAGGNPNKLVVFLHGYGADGKDLIDLANPFGMALPNASFISPDAPHPCAMSPQEGNGSQLRKSQKVLLKHH